MAEGLAALRQKIPSAVADLHDELAIDFRGFTTQSVTKAEAPRNQ